MDETHAGSAYTSHMGPVEESLLDSRSELGLGPWECVCVCVCVYACVVVCVCVCFTPLRGANKDQQVAF